MPRPPVVPAETPRERDRRNRVEEKPARPSAAAAEARPERMGTPGETATPQTTYIPPPDAHKRRSRAGARSGNPVRAGQARTDEVVVTLSVTLCRLRSALA
ncbi:MAG: hypothetical protein WKF84_10595 [Pyrinomonadaceae bacterium]